MKAGGAPHKGGEVTVVVLLILEGCQADLADIGQVGGLSRSLAFLPIETVAHQRRHRLRAKVRSYASLEL